jgi:hypothetical protein
MTLRASLETIRDTAVQVLAELPPEPSARRLVKAGTNLQAAVDEASVVELEAGASFEAVTLRTGQAIYGAPGAAIRGVGIPAIHVLAGARGVYVDGVDCFSTHNCVVQVGDNETQARVEDAPTAIRFERVRVPSHRGKRGFELHGMGVTLIDCSVDDTYDPARRDSQAIYVANSPGDILIEGGSYAAGSEIVLMGGAPTTIPGLIPQNIVLKDAKLIRPLSWRTDGTYRKAKNILEVKSGKGIVVKGCTLAGCWPEGGQQSEAIMLTPTIDGSRTDPPQVSHVSDVLIEDCQIYDCGSILNIIGRDNSSYTPEATANVVLRRVTGVASRARFGGRGQVLMAGVEVGSLTVEDSVFVVDGSSTIYTHLGGYVTSTGQALAGRYAVQALTVQRTIIGLLGEYGLNFEGWANARLVPAGHTFTGNTFGGGQLQRGVAANNTFWPPAMFEALEAVQAARRLGA